MQSLTSDPIGAWKFNFPAFLGNQDRPPTNQPANHPTNQWTEMRKVTLPISYIDMDYFRGNCVLKCF